MRSEWTIKKFEWTTQAKPKNTAQSPTANPPKTRANEKNDWFGQHLTWNEWTRRKFEWTTLRFGNKRRNINCATESLEDTWIIKCPSGFRTKWPRGIPFDSLLFEHLKQKHLCQNQCHTIFRVTKKLPSFNGESLFYSLNACWHWHVSNNKTNRCICSHSMFTSKNDEKYKLM